MFISIDDSRWYDTSNHPTEISVKSLKELLQDLQYIEEDIVKFLEAKNSKA